MQCPAFSACPSFSRRGCGVPRRTGSVEHVGLRVDQLIPDRLKMQPADVLAADMLAAIARAIFGDETRLDAGRFDKQLLLAAALECNEPERGSFDAVTARRQEAVVLVNRRLHTLECIRDLVAGLHL